MQLRLDGPVVYRPFDSKRNDTKFEKSGWRQHMACSRIASLQKVVFNF